MVPTVLLIVPLNLTWIVILNNYYDQASTNFVLLFETLHGFCATVVMILIHYPYRQAFLNMFFKCLMKSEEERPRSVISVGPTLIIADKV
ncbi:hypothetical protein GCK72_020216 [Caenorhabditis remanei]|uniref:G-protein coupled receptors family 1 profile domain-containing protein n=1 Tax=Caenorhabditis remanei TaxID=31234 RepID=A0A6A5GGV1_CAERE|nr:hypothetical protein GCK72_020216 [Caenorhabditis remanei]KAF1753659.1 hypothetical protein GCK72_020216 [Caenorhabditis remanei]